MQRTLPKPTLTQGQSVSEPDLTSSATKVGSNSEDFNITMRANKRFRLNDSPVKEPDPALHPEFQNGKPDKEKDSITANLQADNERLKSNANELTTRLGVVKQHVRESNIETNGIPEYKNENLANTLINLSTTIGSPLNDIDILQITQIAKLNKN
ncbi:hypothetical protein PYW07_006292 [Mythimna separata]|uniref:Uncharacterized protein n=1 Tax=Mythimna separata TaxID=271217 RepID=A0AAD7YU85_MYTSE|nr:hypothetical protein PYW07_006292 [Mythimna separata]